MDVTPATASTKRPRAKAPAHEPAAKPARKTLTASHKKSTKVAPPVVSSATSPPADLHGMIETAAFYLAAERSFAPGHELDDWLEAERRIRSIQIA